MTNTKEWHRNSTPTKNVRSVERHYPGADANTAELVRKLRHRGITDPRAAVRRSSSALMDDACRTPVSQTVTKPFNNNYSPFSNVNMEAAEAVARRQTEERRRAEQKRVSSGSVPLMTSIRTDEKRQPAQRRADVPAQKKSAPPTAKAKAPRAVTKSAPAKTRRQQSGQLAESGPREVAFRRVPFPKFAILIVLLCVVLIFVVKGIVGNYEQQRENAKLRAEVEEYARQAELLRSELERRDDLTEIADRAGQIGMIDGGQVDEKYIDLTGGDTIENFNEEEGRGSFTTMLSAMRKTLSRFLG